MNNDNRKNCHDVCAYEELHYISQQCFTVYSVANCKSMIKKNENSHCLQYMN